jgi:peroxiredoxin
MNSPDPSFSIKTRALLLMALTVCLLLWQVPSLAQVGASHGGVPLGQKLPDLTVTDAYGKALKLADFRGRLVVLEWSNPGCPFVRKHYEGGAMQSLQREFMAKGVVWLTVNSTADGSADFLTAQQWQRWMEAQKATPTALVVDDEGVFGRAVGARSALHMFILNPRAELIYAGAIDSIASAKKEDIAKATNWVRQGLNEALAGKPLSMPASKPYGCPITYRS